jgi:phosphatidylserine/phosphatidylglycerophosphate/cardiolipin synthase-like enzyme
MGFGAESEDVCAELSGLAAMGLTAPALGRVLRMLAAERQAAQSAADRTELVWSGPEARSASSRDTSVVVRDLFSSAERSVHVATFAIFQGRQVFAPLAARMDQASGLKVRIFVNVARPHRDQTRESELLRMFCDEFRRGHWPGSRLPEVYYDPRSLTLGTGPKAALHAKAIVVDDRRALVTSANFTEAAHERNIEAGVLVDSAPFATSLRLQFDSLVESGSLRRLPLTA